MSRTVVLLAIALFACNTEPSDGSQAGDASRDAGSDAGSDPLAACAALDMPAPRTIGDVVARVDALPEPSIECLVASLPRPLALTASKSATSLQPAADANAPRIFIMLEGLTMSVVGAGDGAHRVELGQWVTPRRTLKGELRWPLTRPLASSTPFEGLVEPGLRTSSCGFCHAGEESSTTTPGAFVSDALAPGIFYDQPIAEVRAIRAACTDQPHCALLRALFDYGEVRQGEFDLTVTRGF